jgi:hypothetical protein
MYWYRLLIKWDWLQKNICVALAWNCKTVTKWRAPSREKKLLPYPRDTHESGLCRRTVANRVFPLTACTAFSTPCANVIRSYPPRASMTSHATKEKLYTHIKYTFWYTFYYTVSVYINLFHVYWQILASWYIHILFTAHATKFSFLFESRWGHCIVAIYLILPAAIWPCGLFSF